MSDAIEQVILQKFGKIDKQKGKNGLELIVRCPKCGKRKLSINAHSGFYQCWHGCMTGHIDKLLGSLNELKRAAAIEAIQQPAEPVLPPNSVMPGSLVPLHTLSTQHPAITYIRQRGFDPVELNDIFGVRYCVSGRIFGRIFDTTGTLVFPIWMNGALLGWQSRLLYTPDKMTPDECAAMGFQKDSDGDYMKPPKYFTSPGLLKGRVMMNFDWARRSDVIVVCEGPFDAIAVGRCAVATLGKGVSEYQIRLIKAYWKAAIILLDPGDADKEMAAMERSLRMSLPVVVKVDLKGYKDAGETPREEIWRQIYITACEQGYELEKLKIVV